MAERETMCWLCCRALLLDSSLGRTLGTQRGLKTTSHEVPSTTNQAAKSPLAGTSMLQLNLWLLPGALEEN